MHICHVITRLIIGGAQENTLLTCRGLKEHGHQVTLIAGSETGPEGSLWDDAEQIGCDLIRLDTLRRAVRPMHDWRAHKQLQAIFRRIKPDVVHTHSSKAGILGRSAAARAAVPIIVHTIHGMSFNRTQPAPVRWAFTVLERWAARRTTTMVCVADAMTDQAVAAGIAPRDRFVTVRSGMEVDRFKPDEAARQQMRQSWGVCDDDIVVGTIARVFKNKGYEQIIAAMPRAVTRHRRLKFVWVGHGAHRQRYERQLRRLDLADRVHLVGLVEPRAIPELLSGFDVLLHASRWEGLPRAVVQALLTDVPAISFDNDGAPEVVISDETGVLVRYGDIAGLSDAIVKLAQDGGLRSSLGRAGRARCEELFDWRKMAEDLDALYARLSDGVPLDVG